MEIKIIKARDPEKLEKTVNDFLEFCPNVKNVSISVGAFPTYAEFYAVVLYE
jgi:hypothetical protein